MAAPGIARYRVVANHRTHLVDHFWMLLAKRRREPARHRWLHKWLYALILRRVNALVPGGLGLRRHAAHGVTQRQALEEFGMLQRQELPDHATQRASAEVRAGQTQGLQEST